MSEENFKFAAIFLTGFLAFFYFLQTALNFNPAYNAFNSPIYNYFLSIFGHANLNHLFNNMFFIGLFGSIFEKLTDAKTILATFILSGLFANLSAFLFFPNSYIIGASGGAMGILAALAIYRPNKIGIVLGIPAPMYMVLLGYIIINLVGLSAATNVAYEAHLFGIVIGSIIGYRLRKKPFINQKEDNENASEWEKTIERWEEKYMKN
ncbi:MAG: rhomboid family intramembrane serine protease [Candidatus Nanohaloarchaea archaeon]